MTLCVAAYDNVQKCGIRPTKTFFFNLVTASCYLALNTFNTIFSAVFFGFYSVITYFAALGKSEMTNNCL